MTKEEEFVDFLVSSSPFTSREESLDYIAWFERARAESGVTHWDRYRYQRAVAIRAAWNFANPQTHPCG